MRKVGAEQPVQIAERVTQGFRIAEYGDRLRGVFHDLDTCVGHGFGGGGLHGCRVLDAYIVGFSGHDGETLDNALFVAARFLADLPARIAVRAKVIAVPHAVLFTVFVLGITLGQVCRALEPCRGLAHFGEQIARVGRESENNRAHDTRAEIVRIGVAFAFMLFADDDGHGIVGNDLPQTLRADGA